MKDNSFTTTIELEDATDYVFNCICQVSKWWTTDFEGSSVNFGDEFVICHPGAHYSKQQVVELIPGKKVAWLVTDSKLDWLKNMEEWTNTRMVFEVSKDADKTRLRYTHDGLVPELECYSRVTEGWRMVIGEQLFNFITTGKTI